MTLLESLTAQQTKKAGSDAAPRDVELAQTLIGPGPAGLGLQVVVGNWKGSGAPHSEARTIHTQRLGKKIFPLVVALTDSTGATWVMGPSSDAAPVGPIPESQAARILQAGLDEPTGIKGRQRISALLRSFESTEIAGMTNSGLFATHFLTQGVRETPIWAVAAEESRPWLGLRGEHLVSAMGYSARRAASAAYVLTTKESNEPRAIAVLLSDKESFDSSSARFAVSPVAFGLNLAQREGADWLMVLRGPQIRLYPAKPGVGVGSRGLAETYFEVDLALLSEEDGGFLGVVFSANSLGEKGSINMLLEGSNRYATGLGLRLRQRVYDEVVPSLSVAVANRLGGEDQDLYLAYRITLRILFRLLFQAYAEDRGLLPYGRNERYTRNSLKRWARDFVEQPRMVDRLDVESHAIWDDLRQVWGVIDTGNNTWDVPAYNGGLFGADPSFHAEGALIADLELDDVVTGSALRHLLVDVTPDGELGPVDFRSLSVREFGTIYEGLLESSLSRTEVDLTLDKKAVYITAEKKDEVKVPAGSIYFHNKSGERKATGSYFTPSFAVAHLLERALEPTLQNHLEQVAALLDAGDQAGAQEKFFDFRVADLAMGSGHFLVSAIDTIEAGMSAFLTDHNLPGVADELRRLEDVARAALGDDGDDYEIEPSGLLRRQIARRCIYGLDINEIAVELARVGIWIHTFVPGLPMSSLDHNLVCANSLTGIGTVDESLDALEPKRKKGMQSILATQIAMTLDEARQLLVAAANTSEATKAEVAAAARAAREAADRAFSAKLIFDAAVAARTGMLGDLRTVLQADEILDMADDPVTSSEVAALQPGHMPYLFPEVFLRENPGFDCLVGNPPWEKLHVEDLGWWTLRFPGLRGLSAQERQRRMPKLKSRRPDLVLEFEQEATRVDWMRKVIASGPYPGIGAAHIDLFQVFAWRMWQLLRDGGCMGAVLPRGALSGSGTADWRRTVLSEGSFSDVCFLTNTGQWVFNDVDGRYTIALTAIEKGGDSEVAFSGPHSSLDSYVNGRDKRLSVPASEFSTWSEGAAFPTMGDPTSAAVFRTVRSSPSLNELFGDLLVPMQGDVNSTSQKKLFDFDISRAGGRIPVLMGASIHIWNPDFGAPYAFIEREDLVDLLLTRAKRQVGLQRSPLAGMEIVTDQDLPFSSARLAYRRTVRANDTRTAIPCLVPPEVALAEQAPFFVRRSGADATHEAYLLGIMASIPFDWYVRKWVELNLSFALLNTMPIPRPDFSREVERRIVELSARLAARDRRFDSWASLVDIAVGTLNQEPRRSDALAEIDALVSLLYGLSWDQVEHIFKTFHRGWDYMKRLAAVKQHFDRWKGA